MVGTAQKIVPVDSVLLVKNWVTVEVATVAVSILKVWVAPAYARVKPLLAAKVWAAVMLFFIDVLPLVPEIVWNVGSSPTPFYVNTWPALPGGTATGWQDGAYDIRLPAGPVASLLNVTLLSKLFSVVTALVANLALHTALFAIVITPLMLINASPVIWLKTFTRDVCWDTFGFEISISAVWGAEVLFVRFGNVSPFEITPQGS